MRFLLLSMLLPHTLQDRNYDVDAMRANGVPTQGDADPQYMAAMQQIRKRMDEYNTPLHRVRSYVELQNLLASEEGKRDLNKQGYRGKTPLMHFTMEGNQVTNWHPTLPHASPRRRAPRVPALCSTCFCWCCTQEAVDLLVQAGADPSIGDKHGCEWQYPRTRSSLSHG